MQRILEGWTHVPPLDGTESGESDLHEPSLSVEEEVPENLGHKWRVLHPFDLPGVRFLTDTTPPNQRGLAENDALVELIQTTEYLEDVPMWGQRDYLLYLYPPRYGDPFYRGRGRGRGRREMISERPPERDSTQGFGRGLTQGSFGRGNGRRFYSQGPLDRNERYSHADRWSDAAIEGRRRSDAPIYSPTTHSRHPRTPLTPAQSEDRLFTDWSSIGSRSPTCNTTTPKFPIEQTVLATRIKGIQETDQTALKPSQSISQQSCMGATDDVVQGSFPTTSNICQQPLERSNVPSERRMNDMGINTSDMVIEPTRSGLRTSSMEANTQTSIPIVDVLLPSGLEDQVTKPHVNLSISGYEPDSLRTSCMRSPSMRAQGVSAIPQLDGPRSLPMRDHTRGRVGRFLSQVGQDSSQGGTYMWRTSPTRRREYLGGDSDSNGYRRPH